MFDTIRNFISRAVNRLLGKDKIKEVFDIELPSAGVMEEKIQLWAAMYEGRAPWLSKEYPSTINIAAFVASEIARLSTVEFLSELSGSPRADLLNEYYQVLMRDAKKIAEYGLGYSDIIVRPYYKDGGFGFDYAVAGKHRPIAFDNKGYSTAEIFEDKRTVGDKYYTLLSYQRYESGVFYISNRAFKSDNASDIGEPTNLSAIPDWKDLSPDVQIAGVTGPLWGHFKPNYANNIDPQSPYSVSIFSRAVDSIKNAEIQYNRIQWEAEAGETAIFADQTAFERDSRGKARLPQGKERLYQPVDIEAPDGRSSFFEVYAPTLRDQSQIAIFNENLSIVEDNCEIARGTISDKVQAEAKTATELNILKQRTYTQTEITQDALEDCLRQVAYAMEVWASVYNIGPAGKVECTVDRGDSILDDKREERLDDLLLVREFMMPKVEFLVRHKGLTVEQAKEWITLAERERDSGLEDEFGEE